MEVAKKGQQLYIGAELITEEGAKVSLFDFNNRTIDVSSASHVKLGQHGIKLFRGYSRIGDPSHNYIIESPNAIAQIGQGEAVISYDPVLEKTQLLNLTGQAIIASQKEKAWRQEVSRGYYSSVQKDVQDGLPRMSYRAGSNTIKVATSCLLYTSPSPRDATLSRMPSSA